ncbi:MAG: DUF177 domain-containing protein, partial [Lachnospiraceae bacterium]|nr:DUF177 domain-containing protein [Lachnospiraceae bacterium]
ASNSEFSDSVLSVAGKEMTVQAVMEDVQTDFQGESMVVRCREPFDIVLRSIDQDTLRVEADVSVTVDRSCSRCLETVVCNEDLHIERTINVAKKEAYIDDASETDEISYIEDCTLDVDMLILDELYTAIPMNILCKEDCKGICKVCGMNLNTGICECDQTVPNPRMAVFSDIFNQFKEV